MWTKLLLQLVTEVVAWYLNCLHRVVLAHAFTTLATFPVCQTDRTISIPPSSINFRGHWFVCMGHLLLITLGICLLMFPLPAPLCGHTSSPRETRKIYLHLFCFCCLLGYFNIYSMNAFTQETEIKLRNSFKGQCCVDLSPVYSFTSLSRMPAPLSVALVHDNFRSVVSFLTHTHHNDAVMKGWQSCLLLVHHQC